MVRNIVPANLFSQYGSFWLDLMENVQVVVNWTNSKKTNQSKFKNMPKFLKSVKIMKISTI